MTRRFQDMLQSAVARAAPTSAPEVSDSGTHRPPEHTEQGLRRLIAESRLHWWEPGDPIPSQGRRFLIGVATWCGYDMRLLDALNEAVRRGQTRSDRIDVFDFDDVTLLRSDGKPKRELEQYIPGMD